MCRSEMKKFAIAHHLVVMIHESVLICNTVNDVFYSRRACSAQKGIGGATTNKRIGAFEAQLANLDSRTPHYASEVLADASKGFTSSTV